MATRCLAAALAAWTGNTESNNKSSHSSDLGQQGEPQERDQQQQQQQQQPLQRKQRSLLRAVNATALSKPKGGAKSDESEKLSRPQSDRRPQRDREPHDMTGVLSRALYSGINAAVSRSATVRAHKALVLQETSARFQPSKNSSTNAAKVASLSLSGTEAHANATTNAPVSRDSVSS